MDIMLKVKHYGFQQGPEKGLTLGHQKTLILIKNIFSLKIFAWIVFSLPYHPSSSWLFQGANYPFETDNFCMYSLMGSPEPDIQFSYSLRFSTDTGQFKLLFVSYLKELSGFLYIRIRPDYPYPFDRYLQNCINAYLYTPLLVYSQNCILTYMCPCILP